MAETYPYNYNKQFEKYIQQTLRAFKGFQVVIDKDNNKRTVPTVYGGMERIIADLLNKRKSFTNQTVPIIAGDVQSIEVSENRKTPTNTRNVKTYKSSQGDTIQRQSLNGPPFRVNMNLTLYTSSVSQLFELLEQILLLFNPRITIQKSNDVHDPNYITEIELTNINNDIQTISTEDRIVAMTLNIAFNVRLNYPAIELDNYIEKIQYNIFDETQEVVGLDDGTITEDDL